MQFSMRLCRLRRAIMPFNFHPYQSLVETELWVFSKQFRSSKSKWSAWWTNWGHRGPPGDENSQLWAQMIPSLRNFAGFGGNKCGSPVRINFCKIERFWSVLKNENFRLDQKPGCFLRKIRFVGKGTECEHSKNPYSVSNTCLGGAQCVQRSPFFAGLELDFVIRFHGGRCAVRVTGRSIKGLVVMR